MNVSALILTIQFLLVTLTVFSLHHTQDHTERSDTAKNTIGASALIHSKLIWTENARVIAISSNISSLKLKYQNSEAFNKMWENVKVKSFKGGLYGALAGLLQVITMMWLRTAVNYQYRYGVTLSEAFNQLYNKGGIARFYSGLPYAILQGPLSKFGTVASIESSKVFTAYFFPNNSSPFIPSILGTFLSTLWRLFLMPLDTCKTVLQVDGRDGLQLLLSKVFKGNFQLLYRGSLATISLVLISYYPWFYTYGLLDKFVKIPKDMIGIILRNGFIGFIASAVSDICSNSFRVIKTMKQSFDLSSATSDSMHQSYGDLIRYLLQTNGWYGLMGRGLLTRILTNGIQSMVFTILWKIIPIIYKKYFKRIKIIQREDPIVTSIAK